MANHYTKASFTIDVTAAEAALIGLAFEAAALLAEAPDAAEAAAAYLGLGPAFAAALPAEPQDPFASFRDLFNDGDYPGFGCAMEPIGGRDDDQPRLWFGGEQVAIDALPRLFDRVAPSALPFAFEYSFDCDRLRIGEFGGGIAIVTADGADWITTRDLVEAALGVTPPPARFVLALRDPRRQFGFWNRDTGFGALADATVFSEAEKAAFTAPVDEAEREWMALPASRLVEAGR